MANNQQLIALIPFLFLILAVHLTSANETVDSTISDKPGSPVAEKVVDLVVEGMVYCQRCEEPGFTGAKPIASATISVTCIDDENKVSYLKAFKTDEGGHFYAELKGYKMSHSLLDHPDPRLQPCKVRLVASPLKECNLPTNTNDGLTGAPLRSEKKKISGPNYEAVIYAAGPLAFRPLLCPLKQLQVDDQLPHV